MYVALTRLHTYIYNKVLTAHAVGGCINLDVGMGRVLNLASDNILTRIQLEPMASLNHLQQPHPDIGCRLGILRLLRLSVLRLLGLGVLRLLRLGVLRLLRLNRGRSLHVLLRLRSLRLNEFGLLGLNRRRSLHVLLLRLNRRWSLHRRLGLWLNRWRSLD